METEAKERYSLGEEAANGLVLEHQGWAESIARAVARAWDMDWRLDGLDGAAMEALIFCSRRFDPRRGIPFRGYARKRIHEAATEAARKSKGWLRAPANAETRSREVSAELYEIFPELREGLLPIHDPSGNEDADIRSSIRDLLMGASIVASRMSISDAPQPDEMVDYKRMVHMMAVLDPVHQWLLYRVYWDGLSLRTVAEEWDTDGLNVMREHKVLLVYLQKSLAAGKPAPKPKVRPGLKALISKLSTDNGAGPFSAVIQSGSG